MTFQFLCPQGHLLQGEDEHMGMQCQCPQCGVSFIIPTVQQSPATQATESSAASPPPPVELPPLDADEPLADSAGAGGLAGLNVSQADASDLDEAAASESLLHIPCPNGHELEVPLDMIGQRALCPHCRTEFRLRREKSAEYILQQELLDRKRAEFWFRLAIIAASVVGVVLLIMFLAIMFT